MNYVLKNAELTVTLSDLGAEMISVRRGTCEYVWQKDDTYWKDGQAPLLFPICGRLIEGAYAYEGTRYEMAIHGFAKDSVFQVAHRSDCEIEFVLEADEATKSSYPFDFSLSVIYRLEGDTLATEAVIRNRGSSVMPATFGAHPGFYVPLDGAGRFEDYWLEFSKPCSPDEVVMTPTCFLTGERKPFLLERGRYLPLRHSLFDIDAIFLARVSDSVTLKSDKTPRSVTLTYPDMPYLGIWHMPRTDAPYVCIEPWCGLPDYNGKVGDIMQKSDMFRIPAGGEKTVSFAVGFQ